jgi:hypothetical protein
MSIDTKGILSAYARDFDTDMSSFRTLKLSDVSFQPKKREEGIRRTMVDSAPESEAHNKSESEGRTDWKRRA